MSKLNFLSDFIRQVKTNPLTIAIVENNKSLSYKELYQKSLSVYHYLKGLPVQEKLIGIDCNAGADSYAFIIGVWLYGAAYVPLNDEHPKNLLNEIIESAVLKVVLSKNNRQEIFENKHSSEWEKNVVSQDIAYVIFTSGTTGKPKGVCVSKLNLNSFTNHYLKFNRYNFNEQDSFLQSYELSFDVSVFCFTLPLMLGAKLYLLPEKGIKYMNIAASIMKNNITVCSNVPSVAMYLYPRLKEISFPNLRYCFFSGEALYGNWAKAWMESAFNAQVFNCYGPTETTIVCTTENLNDLPQSYFASSLPLPLGNAFEEMQLELNEGEICFTGNQVFPKYLDGDLGNRKKIKGKEYYCTGDLGFIDNNGKLIFSGRKDEQFQIDGFRVELGTLDVLIRKELNTNVKSYVFTIKGGKKIIVSAIETDNEISKEMIHDAVLKELPVYYCPTLFISLKVFPRNNNGKLAVGRLKEKILQELELQKLMLS